MHNMHLFKSTTIRNLLETLIRTIIVIATLNSDKTMIMNNTNRIKSFNRCLVFSIMVLFRWKFSVRSSKNGYFSSVFLVRHSYSLVDSLQYICLFSKRYVQIYSLHAWLSTIAFDWKCSSVCGKYSR